MTIEVQKMAVILDEKDNVAVVLADLEEGEACTIKVSDNQVVQYTAKEKILFGHKIALEAIGKDQAVIKYGEQIGKLKVEVQQGGWIHSHNMYCERGMTSGR